MTIIQFFTSKHCNFTSICNKKDFWISFFLGFQCSPGCLDFTLMPPKKKGNIRSAKSDSSPVKIEVEKKLWWKLQVQNPTE